MLTTHEIGELFHSMRTAYGNQWKHGPEAMEVWRRALSRISAERIQRAATECLVGYVDHPPNLPQFLEICTPKTYTPVANTYLAPPKMLRTMAVGNKTLLFVLRAVCGVDEMCMQNLVALKNALVEEFLSDHDDRPTRAFVRDMHKQLTALADNHDKDAKAREAFQARGRRFGFPDPELATP